VTANPERQAHAAARYPGAAILPSVDQVWAGDYDLVVVATPNARHVSLARAALDAGLPVVVDKPVAPTAAEARSLSGGPLVAGRPMSRTGWTGKSGSFATA
jgi:scyllo-inositol 2-dehydrogenase (NADP+)